MRDSQGPAYPYLVSTQLKASQLGRHLQARYLRYPVLDKVHCMEGVKVLQALRDRLEQVERQIQNPSTAPQSVNTSPQSISQAKIAAHPRFSNLSNASPTVLSLLS